MTESKPLLTYISAGNGIHAGPYDWKESRRVRWSFGHALMVAAQEIRN